MTREYFLLKGQDKMMITSLEQRISNTISCYIIVNPENSQEFIYKTIVKRIERVLRKETHYLRARQNLNNSDEYYYTQEKSNRLAKKIVQLSDKYLTHLELGKILAKSGMSVIIRVYKNSFFIAVTHLFIDGLHFAEIIGICLDNQIVDYSVIPKFNYIPGLIEASVIPGIIGSVKSLSTRKLSVDRKWNTHLYPIQRKYYTNEMCDIKQIKGYLTNLYGKFGFSATLAVISGIYTFENIKKDEINIGIVAAFINDERFNNFSSFIIKLKRPHNWSSISLIQKVNDISCQIDCAINSYGKSLTIINYLITNVYNLDIYTNDMIDVLVSCAPAQNRCVFNGEDAELELVEMYGTSMPLYIGFWTNNDCVKTCAFSRSNDIDLNTNLQIKKIVKEINSNHNKDYP